MARDRPEAAETLIEGLVSRLRSLERLSDRGAVPRDSRLRRAGYRYLSHSDYLIFYKTLARQVRVYRVLHGAQQYAHLL